MTDFTPTEMMTIAAARALGNDDVCFVGIGAPSAACNVARLTHAPDITLIYEIRHHRHRARRAAAVDRRRRAVRDRALHRLGARDVPLLAEGGRISIGFLGAAQLDKLRQHQHHRHRRLRAPEGPPARRRRRAGDRDLLRRDLHHPEAGASARMVEKIDFFTSLRPRRGRRSPPAARHHDQGADAADHRPRHLAAGPGDQGVHRDSLHPRRHARRWCRRPAAGRCASPTRSTKRRAPTELELGTLRDLQARTGGRAISGSAVMAEAFICDYRPHADRPLRRRAVLACAPTISAPCRSRR